MLEFLYSTSNFRPLNVRVQSLDVVQMIDWSIGEYDGPDGTQLRLCGTTDSQHGARKITLLSASVAVKMPINE